MLAAGAPATPTRDLAERKGVVPHGPYAGLARLREVVDVYRILVLSRVRAGASLIRAKAEPALAWRDAVTRSGTP